MKKSIFFAVTMMALTLIGCEQGESTVTEEPVAVSPIQTTNFTGVTSYTAVVAGLVNVNVSTSQDTVGIMYSENKDSLAANVGNAQVATFFNGKEFELEIKDLQPKTTYYYCAWLTIAGKPTTYGEVKQFTTLAEGSVKAIGEFSVAENTKVAFSQGNLQYRPTTKTWIFASNQLEFLGEANANIAPSYLGWIDMFGWAIGDDAAKSSTNNADYAEFVAWGNDTISGEPNTWRALTADEWNYLLNKRQNASSLYAAATVNEQRGVVLFPDNWSPDNNTHVILPYDTIVILVDDSTTKTVVYTPKVVELPDDKVMVKLPNDTIKVGHNILYAGLQGWDANTYSETEWTILETAGVVFLPAAGSRRGASLNSVQSYGRYWSVTEVDANKADAFCFYDYGWHVGGFDRFLGQSVRLVTEL